ncbi:GRIP and coiled-coil domain-containing protein 2-like isoform X2 [Tenebrio molitor]
MHLQIHNVNFVRSNQSCMDQSVVTEVNSKLIQMELTRFCLHCTTCKYRFPIFNTKSPTVLFTEGRSPQKTSSCMYPNSKSQEVPWAQKSPPGSPKPASSDPQITKSRGNFADEGKFGQRKIFDTKSGRINQLEKDLIMMRSQIGGLAKNKNTISTVVNELQMSHQNLLQKNEEQERQVQILKCENQKLLEQLKEPVCNDDAAYLVGVKRSLNLCENKLNKLDSTMIKLIKCYQTSKENEVRYEYENRKLIKTNRELNNMLKQSLGDLEKFQNDADHLKKLYEELNETCDYYLQELKEKCQVTEQLSSLINELDPQPTDQVNQLDDIKVRYQKILAQQESIELKLKAFELNNKKRLTEIMEKHGTQLNNTLVEENKFAKNTSPQNENIELQSNIFQAAASSINSPTSSEPTMTKSNFTAESSRNFEELVHILHEEIDRTLSRDHVIQDHYKNLCHMECILCLKEEQFNTHHQVRIGRILDGQSLSSDINRLIHRQYSTTVDIIDDDYELECVCEPCEEQ